MKINERKPMGAIAAVVLVTLLLASAAQARSLSLKPPSLANTKGWITARFGVAVEDLPILKGELEDGATLVLTCEVGLLEGRDYWLDREVASGRYICELHFDALKREYVLTPARGGQAVRGRDIGKLLEAEWGSIEVGLGSWALLQRGSHYSLRIRTIMNEKDAPDGIMRYIYFWSWDAGAENSFQLDFTY